MEELTHQAHQQSCDAFHQGLVTLRQHVQTQRLMWKRNQVDCLFFQAEEQGNLVEAQGVFLCPQCQIGEMGPISATENLEETVSMCEPQLQHGDASVRDASGVLPHGPLQHHETEVSGKWLYDLVRMTSSLTSPSATSCKFWT